MATNLLIYRHGPAGSREAWAALGKKDEVRPLTPEGIGKIREAVKGLRRVLARVDAIASSPLARAVQTADELARCYPAAKRATLESLRPEGSPEEVLREIRGGSLSGTVVLVGHEPLLGETASRLLHREAASFLTLKKGAAALISFPGEPALGGGTLEWLLQPKALRRL